MSPKELSKFEDKTSVRFVASIVPPYLFSDYGDRQIALPCNESSFLKKELCIHEQ